MVEGGRWVWLGGSLLLAVATSQVAWWVWRREKSRARLSPFVHSFLFSVLLQLARLVYYVGLPFTALVWGHAVVERFLGLQPLVTPDPAASLADWARDLGWIAGLGVATWALLAVGWRTVRKVGDAPEPAGAKAPAWILLREAAFHEAHWAFYRNAPVVVLSDGLGVVQGEYWGVWVGLGLVALEAVLNPWWRANLADAGRAPAAFLICLGLSV